MIVPDRIAPARAHALGYAVALAKAAIYGSARAHLVDVTAEDSETWPHAVCGFRPRSGWLEVGIATAWPDFPAICPRCIARFERAMKGG